MNELPTETALDDARIAKLSPTKRALLLRRHEQIQKAIITPQHEIPRHLPKPLSFSQQRLWIINQMDPDSPVYNTSRVLKIDGPLQVSALAGAVRTIIFRHETLRTVIAVEDNIPVQVVVTDWRFDLPLMDLGTMSADERQEIMRSIIRRQVDQPFDLTVDLMVRACLVRFDEESHILIVIIHHIATDGWSAGVFVRELSALYGAFVAGAASPLPKLPIQYGDFAVWQGQSLQGEFLETLLAYWQRQLADAPSILELPGDRPRTGSGSRSGMRESFALPKHVFDGLKELSRSENVTPFMTLLAAFQILLNRYTTVDNIVVGTPVANRKRIDDERLIGFFVNTLVMHADFSGDPSFREALSRVREMAIGAYAHEDLPFEMLVDALQPTRDVELNPLFQVMFIFNDAIDRTINLPGLNVSNLPREIGYEQFDLTISMVAAESQLTGSLTYNSDLFEAKRIRRMIGHFRRLIEGIVDHPETPISCLPLLTDGELDQIPGVANGTSTAVYKNRTIHQLFEEQAARTPGALAAVAEDLIVERPQSLTYSELNKRANQLANYLQKKGVGAEVLVGICMERSLEMLIGLMGILKAGGAYVPLDPEYPEERLAFISEDTELSIVLTQSSLIDTLPMTAAQKVALDSDWALISRESGSNVIADVTGDNIAYVMYTSGSTGQAKGVVVLHRGVCNYLLWRKRYFPLNPSDRVLQKTSFGFVDSIWELFEPLMVGAHLIFAAPGGHQDLAYLVRFIVEQRITAADFIPSLLQFFLEEPGVGDCISLRRVTTGSETVTVALQERFFSCLTAGLYNLYGPTEASIASTCWSCCMDERKQNVPIGCPIDNTRIYLLDAHRQPVPEGIPGEVFIGGAGLARGYLNRPALTGDKFVPDPLSDVPGMILYSTGDLARYIETGTSDKPVLEFLGRRDHQIKIRGYRIELGEVEAVLRQHPDVHDAVVILWQAKSDDQRLVAYLVSVSERRIETVSIRSFLRGKLPAYMIPTLFVVLDCLPMTPNGKIDRRALPEPDITYHSSAHVFVPPRSQVEVIIAEIWTAVLGIRKVGINDNFFELGGHSLLAIQVILRIRKAFSLDLPLITLFEQPTVAGLAQRIELIQAVGNSTIASPDPSNPAVEEGVL